MTKVSSLQAAALMLCFTLTRLISYRSEGTSLAVTAAAELAACIIMFAVCAAASKLPKAKGAAAVTGCAAAGAWVLAALTLLFTDLAGSMQYSFPDFYSSGAMIAAFAAAAAYCASMGLSGCARAACAAVIGAAAALALMIGGASGGLSLDRLHFAVPDKGEQFGRQLLTALLRSPELPLFIALSRRGIDRPVRAAGALFSARAVLWTALPLVCTAVLGDHSLMGQPVWSLAAYSKTSLIERFDAIVLLVGVLAALLAAAALTVCLHDCIEGIRPGAGRLSLPAVIIPAGVSAALMYGSAGRPPELFYALALAVGLIGALLMGGGKQA